MTVIHVFTPHRLDDKLLRQVRQAVDKHPDLQTAHLFCTFYTCDNVEPTTGDYVIALRHRHPLLLRQQWIELLYAHMPTYVHLHGEANITLAHIARWTTQRSFKVVYTTHNPDVKFKTSINYIRTKFLADTYYRHVINRYTHKKHNQTPLSDQVMHTILLTLKNYYDNTAPNDLTIKQLNDQTTTPKLQHLAPNDKITITQFAKAQQIETPVTEAIAGPGTDPNDPITNLPNHQTTDNTALLRQLKALQQDIKREITTLRQLGETYYAFRTYNDDEQELIRQARNSRQYKFLQHIETIMKDMFNLNEGYMPTTPLNNRYTNSIRRHIYNALFKT